MGKKTLVIGASENPERYANKAVKSLQASGHPVHALGRKSGNIGPTSIVTEKKIIENLDTVSLYLAPQNQEEYLPYILELNPKRVIFNPGTENPELYSALADEGIEVEQACTLVLLATDQY